jgi:cell division transport system ATP-binding protein
MIRFESVFHNYGGQSSLKGVDLKIEEGEFVFLIGSTGAGKTTLLRLVLAQQLPASGRVEVFGRDTSRLRRWELPYHRRRIGCVFQDFKLLRSRSVSDNVALALHIYGMRRAELEERVSDTLKLVGLEAKARQPVERLSGGEQQRVVIARAIVSGPPLILADEPTGNLDPITAAETMHLFLDIQARGSTVLCATHNLELVRLLGQRTIALQEGRVAEDEPGVAQRLRGAMSDKVHGSQPKRGS